MKNLLIILCSFLSITTVFAQHEHHHQPSNAEKKTESAMPEGMKMPGDSAGTMKHDHSKMMMQKPVDEKMVSTLPLSRPFAEKFVKPTGKRVEYDIYVSEQEVNFTGKTIKSVTLNGGIPGPTLQFTEGDIAVIRVHNQLNTETSIHWHGILLPNRQDGVSYLNTPPILAGTTHTFEFPIVQSGTYWYHSHTAFQEQRGVYGSIAIQPQKVNHPVDKDLVLVLSDWTNENPDNVLRNLKRRNEWYSIRKNNIQSLDRILKNKALGAYLKQSSTRMPPMDISDIAYDAFLINGKKTDKIEDLKPGEKVRLRVINASASTYFHVTYAGNPMTLIAADGVDVQPVKTTHRLMGMAETYDFLITIPENDSYEFRATAQDGSGFASVFLGKGNNVPTSKIPAPDLYRMTKAMSNMDMKHMDMNEHEGHQMSMTHEPAAPVNHSMNHGLDSLNNSDYGILKSTEAIVFPKDRKVQTIPLKLTGDMRRYIWGFNGKPMSVEDKIKIRRGEVVRFTLINTTMMYHPIHLHGHFFRVLNGQGEYSPLKHTISLAPMETQTIEFLADDEKDWMFHCHLLYHMDSGMARVVSYEGDEPDPDMAENHHKHLKTMNDNKLFFWGTANIGVTSNYLNLTLSNNKNAFIIGGDANWKGDYEFDIDYERYLSQYFRVFGGLDAGNELFLRKSEIGVDNNVRIIRPVIGFRYLLPFLIDSEVKLDAKGNVRFQLSGQQRLTRKLGLELEYQWLIQGYTRVHVGLDYVLTKNTSLFTNYDTRYNTFGGGLSFKF
ncbi:Multicopper oxidase with three cupredoxin domains (includes cell division protein FtsP and spore coat protein CotA) [Pseudarcicella hirudinis]|uniref:Multicopper oxidase with three cupredoxin domains (Includes cell division protein FtsP and spore coat protein CotA) n=1 Tax=Pseudarcicella hirudinis TaxID=1079859 RepID=A0A1I5Y5N6_9BACT|nr:multicopper oxidase domain-containing protein [Pseudarcicella hirudinis]SFQ39516.1 Multicopper oxidase with three cupredoxin domains (includes cell division protein FtsP and spore coat protein CotA) [Pseudarcicella hirudinis]